MLEMYLFFRYLRFSPVFWSANNKDRLQNDGPEFFWTRVKLLSPFLSKFGLWSRILNYRVWPDLHVFWAYNQAKTLKGQRIVVEVENFHKCTVLYQKLFCQLGLKYFAHSFLSFSLTHSHTYTHTLSLPLSLSHTHTHAHKLNKK